MQEVFRTLTDLALDPFARLAAIGETHRELLAASAPTRELELAMTNAAPNLESVANGCFSSCETCIDPGGDPDDFPA